MRMLADPSTAVLGVLAVETDASEARLKGRPLPLTYAQRRVLLVLVRNGGRVVDRPALYEAAFGRAAPSRSRAIDTHVNRIRRALAPHNDLVVCVNRVGYRLDADLARALTTSGT